MTSPLRLAFLGTPDFAVPILEALLAAGHELAAVYCQPPRPAGRGKKERPSPVQAAAERHGLAVRTPASLKDAAVQADFAALALDAAVVAAYGLILPKAILQAPRLGCLNVHASLLPRWRGAAPIQRAILSGDRETGVTIMQMDEGLDTGAILLARPQPILATTSGGELHDALAALGAALIVTALQGVADSFRVAFPGFRLRINDLSLPNGGKFEIDGSWNAATDHQEHRTGGNADVALSAYNNVGHEVQLTSRQQTRLLDLITILSGREPLNESNRNHYHIN